MTLRQMLIEGATGNQKANPLTLLATDAGYRVRCDKLPSGTALKIVMAVVDIKWNPAPHKPRSDFGIFDKDYILKTKFDDGSTYWYGHPDGNVYTPRPSPQNVKIYGEYVAGQRKRTVLIQTKSIVMTMPQVQPAVR
jgi:hypothetical protein